MLEVVRKRKRDLENGVLTDNLPIVDSLDYKLIELHRREAVGELDTFCCVHSSASSRPSEAILDEVIHEVTEVGVCAAEGLAELEASIGDTVQASFDILKFLPECVIICRV